MGGLAEEIGFLLEGCGDAGDLGIGFGPLFLLNGFANAGDGFDAVAGVEAGGVEQVLEPGAVGQAGGVGEDALAEAFHYRIEMAG